MYSNGQVQSPHYNMQGFSRGANSSRQVVDVQCLVGWDCVINVPLVLTFENSAGKDDSQQICYSQMWLTVLV